MLLAGAGLDEIYAQINSSGTTSYFRDGLNSTVALANSSGATTTNYSYSPYGDSVGSGTASTPLQYTGRENDGATGLYYYRARYYSPQLGRFISEDPSGLAGGSNHYAFVDGDPISETDPLGLWGIGDPLPQWIVDYSAGLGDALSLGLTYEYRAIRGTNDVVNFCSVGYWSGVGTGVAIHIIGFRTGAELRLGRNFRLAPWGNRTGNPFGELPHYHRRIVDDAGNTIPGGGIGRHRPWEGF